MVTDKVSIFLVDDDRDDQEIFSEALSRISIPVDLSIFDSAQALLESMQPTGKQPNMIFLDLYMPIMDGEACLVTIRNNAHYRNIPVVIYSTEYDLDQIEHLLHIGANRYLRKPNSFDSLVLYLDTAVKSLKRNPLGGITDVNIIV